MVAIMKNINYEKMANFVIKYKFFIIITTIFFTVVMSFFALKIKVDSDVLKIMPENSDIILEYQKEQKAISSSDRLVVAFFLNDDSDIYEIAEDFLNLMSKENSFTGFTETDISFLLSYGFINFSDTEIIQNISTNINNLIQSFEKSNPYDFSTFEYINNAVSGLYSLEEHMSGDSSQNIMKSYLALSNDKKAMIMGATFSGDTLDIDYINYLIPTVKKNLFIIEEKHNIETGLTADYITQYESNRTIREDFSKTTVITIILIVLIFILSFGSLITSSIVFIGLIISTILTLGISQILFTNLNIITSFVTAITLGLGIDYGIHVITRLTNEYKEKNNFKEALKITYETVFFPLLYAMLSTIMVFLSLLLMGLPAFNEMAIMSALGLFFFFIIMVFFVPAVMYTLKDRIKISGFISHVNRSFKKLGYFLPKNGKKIRFIIIPIVIFSIFGILNIAKYSYTPPGMTDSQAEPQIVFNKLAEHFTGINLSNINFIVKIDENPDEIMKQIQEFETVFSVKSFIDMIEEEIGSYSQLQAQVDNFSTIIKNPIVVSTLKKHHIYTDSLVIIDIASRSQDLYQFSLNIMEILPEDLKSNFFIEKDNEIFLILNISPSISIWRNNGLKTLFNEFGDMSERILGLSKATYKIMDTIRVRYFIPLIVSFFSIWLITLISRKNLRESFEAFLGLLAATTASFGLGYFFKIDATFVTLLTFPLIFGIGADGYIHIFHAIDEDKKHYWHTLKSVTLSFLTSAVSFLSFQIARGDLLKQFSLNMIFAIIFTWTFTVILIPSLRSKTLIGDWNKNLKTKKRSE